MHRKPNTIKYCGVMLKEHIVPRLGTLSVSEVERKRPQVPVRVARHVGLQKPFAERAAAEAGVPERCVSSRLLALRSSYLLNLSRRSVAARQAGPHQRRNCGTI